MDDSYYFVKHSYFFWKYPYVFWISFHMLILGFLFADMALFQMKAHALKLKGALLLSGFWIAIAFAFNGFVYYLSGPEAALQFFTGYLIEKSLSVDNLFIFLAIFTYFKLPLLHQRKVLYWGILGALVFRIGLILAGIGLIQEFHWITYILGAFLVFTGIKFALEKGRGISPPEGNWLVRLCKRFAPFSEKKGGGEFFVMEGGKWKMTHLFLVLLVIESTDVIFALDSIPAVLAVTTDPFIAYTSNVFAILGLRSLYFVLAQSLGKLKHLKMGLSAILVFVGIKMVLASVYSIPVVATLLVIVLILGIIGGLSYSSFGKKGGSV